MEFGKTPFFKEVDYTLPKDNIQFQLNEVEDGQIYLGTPGWNQREWINRIYPKGTKSNEFLYHYSRRFNGIELNSTHYAIPAEDRIKAWKEMVPDGFKFSPKVLQSISHYGLLGIQKEWDIFVKSMMPLEENLGLSFLQLPESFNIAHIRNLESFFKSIPNDFRLAIEFRHPSFFKNQNLKIQISDLLNKNRVATVITDTAGRRDVLHSTFTTNQVMVRCVGNQHDLTDYSRLEDWITKIDSWFQSGLKDLYFFSHQPDNVHSIDFGQRFSKRINEDLDAGLTQPLDIEDELQGETQLDLL